MSTGVNESPRDSFAHQNLRFWGRCIPSLLAPSLRSALAEEGGLAPTFSYTYLGLRERLAANEGARSSVYESTRDRTPLGHAHRDQIRETYPQAITRLLSEVGETEQFFRAGIVAIDSTEATPSTGDRTGYEDEIIGTNERTDEYAYQWATVQLAGNAVSLVLDARPVRKGESRLEIVEDLLNSVEGLIHVDNVLMDREFDSQHVLETISQRGLSYAVPKRTQTSESTQAKRLLQRDQDRRTSWPR